jgi:formylglycine-generating enzyme required for sulfatase activity
MSGNVWEWCWDGRFSYPGDVTDPTGLEDEPTRLGRGGAWNLTAPQARGAERSFYSGAGARLAFRGFRLVRTAPFFLQP